jgi:hypothetical protein
MHVDAGGRCCRCAGELGGSRQHAVVDRCDAPVPMVASTSLPVRRQRHLAQAALGFADGGELRPGPAVGENLGRQRRPPPSGAAPPSSRMSPASRNARCLRSSGASACRRSTASTSRASSAGPMPRPTGCRPSVTRSATCSPMARPTSTRRRPSAARPARCALWPSAPTGRSISTCVEPAAAFLDRTEATSCPSLSRSSGRSTRMRMSSAGLSRTEPPQTMQAPVRSTVRRIAAMSRSTGASTSIVSAVPAGEVIARDEVLGIVSPQAATMGTTRSVVRLPGRPPTQCLSTTSGRGPSPAVAHVDHRPRQRDGLVEVEAVAGAGGDEGGQVQVGVAARRDVADDGAKGIAIEAVAVDLGADMAERIERPAHG